MKVAVIGSRGLLVENLGDYLPEGTTEIVSGGAAGVDACAREYAQRHGLELTEYLPEYTRYGRAAPLKRNITIIENADLVLAFWDGTSRGTKYVIDNCKKRKIPVRWPPSLCGFMCSTSRVRQTRPTADRHGPHFYENRGDSHFHLSRQPESKGDAVALGAAGRGGDRAGLSALCPGPGLLGHAPPAGPHRALRLCQHPHGGHQHPGLPAIRRLLSPPATAVL